MPTINVDCDKHGCITLIPAALHVTLRSVGDDTVEFFSTCCKRYQVQRISGVKVEELRCLGVEVAFLEVPKEALEPKKGSPLTLADLNCFLAELYSRQHFKLPTIRGALWRR